MATCICPGPGSGTGTSSIVSGFPNARTTAAFIVFAMKFLLRCRTELASWGTEEMNVEN
jgi:hypothetical protein